jgi:hypothetical protein
MPDDAPPYQSAQKGQSVTNGIKVVVANNSRQIDYFDPQQGRINNCVEDSHGVAYGVYELWRAANAQTECAAIRSTSNPAPPARKRW